MESTRRVVIEFQSELPFSTYLAPEATNETSPADFDLVTLAAGANTITPPAGARACTIIFPETNTGDDEVLVTLKGISGDTGIVLHPLDPTSIAIDDPTDTFVLTAAAELAGIRLVWS